jgi:hypothetical protein
MKKVLLFITLFISLASFGQEIRNFAKLATDSNYISIGKMQDVNTSIKFYNTEIKGEVLNIRPNGDIYYTPSAFCDCDKCKEFKGMKFLMNFMNGKK